MIREEDAITILKQSDRIGCNLIKANDEESTKYNQESIEALGMAIKALEIVKEVKKIIDEWNDKITEPEEDIYYLCHIEQLFKQKGE
jgi:hypothetical protein